MHTRFDRPRRPITDLDTEEGLLGRLVAIESVNPGLVPGGAGEAEIATFIAEWLELRGLEVHLEETELPGRRNVIGVARGGGGGRSLLLNGHLDTVGAAEVERPFEPRVTGGRVYGRGACDMKCGLAAALLAVRDAARLSLRGDVIFAGVVDEELTSRGTEAQVARWRADAAIVAEPTGLVLTIAHKGFVWLEVETHGVAAHGSRPDLGVDAIVAMGSVLTGMSRLAVELGSRPAHPLLGTASVHASLIAGGRELSTYPDHCRLHVERRTLPGETEGTAAAELQAIVAAAGASDERLSAEVRATFSRPPLELSADDPFARLLREQAAAALGEEPPVVGASYWADSALIASAGTPTVLFGPRGDGAHASVEWADLESVRMCREIYTATARGFCS